MEILQHWRYFAHRMLCVSIPVSVLDILFLSSRYLTRRLIQLRHIQPTRGIQVELAAISWRIFDLHEASVKVIYAIISIHLWVLPVDIVDRAHRSDNFSVLLLERVFLLVNPPQLLWLVNQSCRWLRWRWFWRRANVWPFRVHRWESFRDSLLLLLLGSDAWVSWGMPNALDSIDVEVLLS